MFYKLDMIKIKQINKDLKKKKRKTYQFMSLRKAGLKVWILLEQENYEQKQEYKLNTNF